MVTKIISAAIVVALSCVAYAEGYVENVALYNEDDGLVTVCYDLVSEKPKRIDLVGTASGFDLEFESISGDVGVMITPGVDKCIFWESLEDYPEGLADYEVSLDVEVSDYQPISELVGPAEEDEKSHGISTSKSYATKRKALTDDKMLAMIGEHAERTEKAKKNCEKATKRYMRAAGSGSKTRKEKMSVQRDYECREYKVLKRELIDLVHSFEARTNSNRAKKYLRVLE